MDDRHTDPVFLSIPLPERCEDSELCCMFVLFAAVEHFRKYSRLTDESARRAALWLSERLEQDGRHG